MVPLTSTHHATPFDTEVLVADPTHPYDLLPLPRGFSVQVVPVDEGYERWAATYDAGSNPLKAQECPVVQELLGDLSGRRVIDVGCGTGRHLEWISEVADATTGVEPCPAMLARARARVRQTTFLQGGLPRLPVESASFDTVLCALVLEHIEDLEATLTEFRRILAPSGQVVLSSFHPALCAMGMPVFFDDQNERVRYVLEPSVPHFPAAYYGAARRTGFEIDDLREMTVSTRLAHDFPHVAGREGFPLLMAVRLRRV